MKRALTHRQARTLLAVYANDKGRLPAGDPRALWDGAPPSPEAGRMVRALAALAGAPVRASGGRLSVRLPGPARASNPGDDAYLLRVRVDRALIPDLAEAVRGLRGVTEEGFVLLEAIERAAELDEEEAPPPRPARQPPAPVTRDRLMREIAANHGSLTVAARKLGLGFYEAMRLRDAAPSSPPPRGASAQPSGAKLSRESVEAAVVRHEGSIKATAAEFGVARSTIREWLRRPRGEAEAPAAVTPEQVHGAVVQSGGSLSAAAALLGVPRSTVRGVVEAHDPDGAWAAEGKAARPRYVPRASNPGGARLGEPPPVDPLDVQSALDGLDDPDDPRGPESLVADSVGPVRLVRLEDLERIDPGVKRFRHFRPGALARLEPLQLRRALAAFRPDVSWDERAWRWRDRDGSWRLPPAVILTTPEGHRSLADGLGRYALARGLGFESMPAVEVRARYRGGRAEDGEGEAARALQAVMDEIGLKGPRLGRRSNPPAMTDHELMELFVRERGRFAKKFPRVAEASIEVSEAACSVAHSQCGVRNVAYCTWDGPDGAKKYQRVVVLRRLLSMPRENVVGVIRHELGHLCDERVSQAGAERRADAIAARVTGEKVRYDGNDLQTTGPGRSPRPPNLPQ